MTAFATIFSGYAASLGLGLAFGSREAVLGFIASTLLSVLILGRTR